MSHNESLVALWRRAGTLHKRVMEVSGTMSAMVHAGHTTERRRSVHQALLTLRALLDEQCEIVTLDAGTDPPAGYWEIVAVVRSIVDNNVRYMEPAGDTDYFSPCYWSEEARYLNHCADRLHDLRTALETVPAVKAALPPFLADSTGDRPQWNRSLGHLLFRGEVVKQVRVGVAKNVVKVLDAFQELGWPDRVDDPLPGGRDQQRLHETIKSLNSGLSGLRFRADFTGAGFVWEPAQSP